MRLTNGIALLLGAALLGAILLISFAVFPKVAPPQTAISSADVSENKGNQADGSITQTFIGTVVSVGKKSGELTMKTWDNQQKDFAVDSKTALVLGSTHSKFSELEPGEQIILTAEGNKAVRVVSSAADLQKRSGGSPHRIQAIVPDANEAIRNKGVNPYGPFDSSADTQAENSPEQGLRSLPVPPSQSAGQSGLQSSAGPSEQQTPQKVSGNIVSVDVPNHLITLKTTDGRLLVFGTDFNTQYNLTTAAGMMADLKEGQSITITAQGMRVLSVDANTDAQW